MSNATIGRQYCAKVFDGVRVSEKGIHWSYGQAMNAAATHADQKPDHIVFLETRVVITNDWEDVDFDAEEYRLEQKRLEREAAAEEES